MACSGYSVMSKSTLMASFYEGTAYSVRFKPLALVYLLYVKFEKNP